MLLHFLVLLALSTAHARLQLNCNDHNVKSWDCDKYHMEFSTSNLEHTLQCLGYKKYKNPLKPVKFKRKVRKLVSVHENKGELLIYEIYQMEYYDDSLTSDVCNHTSTLTFLPPYAELFWIPDMDTSSETLFKPKLDSITLYSTGRVKMRDLQRVHKIICGMEFSWFPFDTQNCSHPIIVDAEELDILYDPSQVMEDSEEIRHSLNPDWSIEIFLGDCNLSDEKKAPGKNCFSVDLILKRKTSNHILHTFVPSIMLSIASGTSIYIPCEHMPARMGLSVTTCLSMITLFVGAQ